MQHCDKTLTENFSSPNSYDALPDEVHEVRERVLAAEPVHAQRHVLDGRARRLTVHQVSENKDNKLRRRPSICFATFVLRLSET
jgi:hypothetical protein